MASRSFTDARVLLPHYKCIQFVTTYKINFVIICIKQLIEYKTTQTINLKREANLMTTVLVDLLHNLESHLCT